MMHNLTFDQIVNNIKRDSLRIKKEFPLPGEEEIGNFIDIDKFIDVLYNLLDSGKYIIDPTSSIEERELEKFLFVEEFPDQRATGRNIVTYGIERREPASLSQNKDPFSGTKHYRPLYLGDSANRAEGNRSIHCMSIYDNLLELVCWSSKISNARRVASLLEGFMQKYYWIIRQYVPIFIYQGRSKVIMDHSYGDMRYFGIPIYYFVRTSEMFVIEEQEVRNIAIINEGMR